MCVHTVLLNINNTSVNMDILEENHNFTLNDSINGPVLSGFFALVMVTGLVANLFVIVVTFCHPKSLKKPSTIFLTSLLLADLVVVFVMSFSAISAPSGGWIFGQSVEEKLGVCQFVGFMFSYCILLLIVTLSLLSFDRFLSIVKPFFHRQYMKPHIAVIIVVIAWTILGILNTTPLYGFGRFGYSENHGTCVAVWTGQIPYLVFFLIILTILIGMIVVTSIWICCFTRRFLQQKQQRHQADSSIYVEE